MSVFASLRRAIDGGDSLKPDIVLWVAGILTILNVWKLHVVFPILATTRVLALLTIVGLYFMFTRKDRRPDFKNPVFRWVYLVGFWILVSVPFALVPGWAFFTFREGYFRTVLFVLILAGSIRGLSDLRFILKMAVIGGGIYCGWAVRVGVVDLGFGIYDANDLATVIVGTLPLTMAAYSKDDHWAVKLALAGSVLAMVYSLFNGGSRAGFIAVAVTVAFVVFFASSVAKSKRVGIVVAGALAITTLASAEYIADLKTLTDIGSDYNVSAETGRVEVWKRGIGYMLSNPVFGVGFNNFPTAEGTLSPGGTTARTFGFGFKWSAAHNSFVQVAAELGFPGFTFFMLQYVAAFSILLSVWRVKAGAPEELRRTAQAIGCGIVGFSMAAIFVSQAYSGTLYFLLAVAASMKWVIARTQAQRSSRQTAPARVVNSGMRGGLVMVPRSSGSERDMVRT